MLTWHIILGLLVLVWKLIVMCSKLHHVDLVLETFLQKLHFPLNSRLNFLKILCINPLSPKLHHIALETFSQKLLFPLIADNPSEDVI